MNILVLHPGALGDLILSLPALGLLRRRFPQSRLILAGNLDYLPAVSGGYADQLRSLSSLPLARLFAAIPPDAGDIAFWRSFDRIIAWLGSHDEIFSSNLRKVNPGSIIAAWKPSSGEHRHVSCIFVDSISSWIDPPAQVPPLALRLPEYARIEADEWLRREPCHGPGMIAIHPGAGSREKRWPLERFREVCRWIMAHSAMDLVIVEGPAESGLGNPLAAGLPDSRARVAAGLPLTAVAALLAGCRAFVANDSGVAHLAAGLGVPGVVLFGPMSPEHWRPLGAEVRTLQDNTGCGACGIGAASGHTCMEGIAVGAVLRLLEPMVLEPRARACSPRAGAGSPTQGCVRGRAKED